MKYMLPFFLLFSTSALATCPADVYGDIIYPNTKPVCHTGYYSDYDTSLKLPRVVVWQMSRQNATGCLKRTNNFSHDPLLSGLDASPKDYSHQGYDKGHMADANDFSFNEQEEIESFYMSNMTPQTPNLNRGLWKKLEGESRNWAYNKNLVIFSGPIISNLDRKMSQTVDVPLYFYKIVYDRDKNIALSVIMPNVSEVPGDIQNYITSVDKIEKETNISFPLPRSFDKSTVASLTNWPLAQVPDKNCQ